MPGSTARVILGPGLSFATCGGMFMYMLDKVKICTVKVYDDCICL